MNGDMDWEHIGSVSRTASRIPICNLGRGVATLSDPPMVTTECSGEKSSGVSSSTLGSVMVCAREKRFRGAKVVRRSGWEAQVPAGNLGCYTQCAGRLGKLIWRCCKLAKLDENLTNSGQAPDSCPRIGRVTPVGVYETVR